MDKLILKAYWMLYLYKQKNPAITSGLVYCVLTGIGIFLFNVAFLIRDLLR